MRVLLSARAHALRLNPYVQQLADALADRGVEVVTWSWRRALLGKFDVLHVHWPEFLVTHERPAIRRVYKGLAPLLLAVLKARSTPIVRTVHNVVPHDRKRKGGAKELAALESMTSEFIVMQEHHQKDYPNAHFVKHGHYRDWYRVPSFDQMVPGRLLFAGGVRPYKNVPTLLRAFSGVKTAGATLAVVGRPSSAALEKEISDAADADSRVECTLRFASESELSDHVGAAQAVVLPYAEDNSGVALLALSLGRPLAMPHSVLGEALQQEFGEQWVHLYPAGDITTEALETLLAATAQPPTSLPDMTSREWCSIAAQHQHVYETACDTMSRTVRLPGGDEPDVVDMRAAESSRQP